MIDDSQLIVHNFPEPIRVRPIADVHLGAKEHMAKAWDRFCEKVLATPNEYILLLGDLVNNSIKTSVANPFEEVMRPREQKERMVEKLMPIRHRILGGVPGNHEYRSTKETDQDISYDIMCRLGIEDLYRENMAFIKVGIGERPSRRNISEVSFVICITHGVGGGGKTGCSVNKYEEYARSLDGVDAFIAGHTHKPFLIRPDKIVVDRINNIVTRRPLVVGVAESWLSYGGYAMKGLMQPHEAGHPQVMWLGGTRNDRRIELSW